VVWLFPWSVYFPAVAKLSFRPVDRAGRVRLLALCWIGFVLLFFTSSTTQEYYSMPVYPALALLLGSAMAAGGDWVRRGRRALVVICAVLAVALFGLWLHVRGLSTPADISQALTRHPRAYSLALGHMQDLTLESFAYLRLPLIVAAVAFFVGALGTLRANSRSAFLATALMMVLFFHAARLALVVFDPYMSSRPLAEALLQSPGGNLIAEGHYYEFSSVFFYTDRQGLLCGSRRVNLEYGSNAPGAPHAFIDDSQFRKIWLEPNRYYLVAYSSSLPNFENLAGPEHFHVVRTGGGKVLLTNQILSGGDMHRLPSVQ